MSKLLLKGGDVVLGSGVLKADVLIENGKIIEVGEGLSCDDEIFDCSGKVILPGLIDVHVHFREPGHSHKEDWVTGSMAAISSGVTTVFDMPNNKPPILTVSDLEAKRELIKDRSYVNYGLYMGYNGSNLHEINKAEGICAVKVYCANSTGDMGISDEFYDELFDKANKNLKLCFHAEDEACIEENLKNFEGVNDPSVHSKIRSSECAQKMVRKICSFSEKYRRPIHIAHATTAEEVMEVFEHKEFGASCEVCLRHLMFSTDDYQSLGNFLKVNPPVRSTQEVFSLWKVVKAGYVNIFATDHAPHTAREKEQDYDKAPSGMPEIEMFLPALLNIVNDEGLTLEEVVRLCCENPAELFNIENKGKIADGYDADLVVVDMDIVKVVKNEDVISKCGWTPYNGNSVKGWPVMTFVGGKLIYEDGKFVGKPCGKEVSFKKQL